MFLVGLENFGIAFAKGSLFARFDDTANVGNERVCWVASKLSFTPLVL